MEGGDFHQNVGVKVLYAYLFEQNQISYKLVKCKKGRQRNKKNCESLHGFLAYLCISKLFNDSNKLSTENIA